MQAFLDDASTRFRRGWLLYVVVRWGQDDEPLDDSWARSGVSLLRLLPDLADLFEGFCLVLVRDLAALHLLLDHLASCPLLGCMDRWLGALVFAQSV